MYYFLLSDTHCDKICIIDKIQEIYMAGYVFSSLFKHQPCGIMGNGNNNCEDKDKDRQIQRKTIMKKSLVIRCNGQKQCRKAEGQAWKILKERGEGEISQKLPQITH